MRLASVLSASASGGAASWPRCSPRSLRRQTSTLRRDRSNPACNIEDGPPLSSLLGDSRSVSPEGAFLHGSPKRASRATEPRGSLVEEGERLGAAVGRLRCLSLACRSDGRPPRGLTAGRP